MRKFKMFVFLCIAAIITASAPVTADAAAGPAKIYLEYGSYKTLIGSDITVKVFITGQNTEPVTISSPGFRLYYDKTNLTVKSVKNATDTITTEPGVEPQLGRINAGVFNTSVSFDKSTPALTVTFSTNASLANDTVCTPFVISNMAGISVPDSFTGRFVQSVPYPMSLLTTKTVLSVTESSVPLSTVKKVSKTDFTIKTLGLPESVSINYLGSVQDEVPVTWHLDSLNAVREQIADSILVYGDLDLSRFNGLFENPDGIRAEAKIKLLPAAYNQGASRVALAALVGEIKVQEGSISAALKTLPTEVALKFNGENGTADFTSMCEIAWNGENTFPAYTPSTPEGTLLAVKGYIKQSALANVQLPDYIEGTLEVIPKYPWVITHISTPIISEPLKMATGMKKTYTSTVDINLVPGVDESSEGKTITKPVEFLADSNGKASGAVFRVETQSLQSVIDGKRIANPSNIPNPSINVEVSGYVRQYSLAETVHTRGSDVSGAYRTITAKITRLDSPNIMYPDGAPKYLLVKVLKNSITQSIRVYDVTDISQGEFTLEPLRISDDCIVELMLYTKPVFDGGIGEVVSDLYRGIYIKN